MIDNKRVDVLDAELLADFGHQLRNQLNAILGAAGLLAMAASSTEERELASIVEVGAEQVARLVEEVLDAAMIQSGDFELALHPFNVRSSVESCIGLVAETAGAKGLDLSFRAELDVPSVIVGDSRRVEQILLTLLSGGLERTQRGGVGVELGCSSEGELTRLKFSVRDTGRGVPARILRSGVGEIGGAKLEPGDRLTVLNLATCKQLVEMMDGELRVEQGGVEAGPDAGTLFEFTILAESMPAQVATTPMTLDGMKVLVVSADATERRVMALQTETWGAVATAATLEEAAALLHEGHPFDIALIEHRPPEIDGLALSASIRSLRSPEQLPIVLIAAAAATAEEAGAADSGLVQATLTKPVAPRKLHEVMIQVGARPAVPIATAAVERVAPGALKILVADDNALNQNLLRRLVVKLGHNVDVVSNGREAVAAVAQTPYDAVLMDVLMPEMDGLEAAEAICRRWTKGTRPRLIALTALAGPGDQDRCLKAGFDDYMIKPVHLEQLKEAFKVAAGWRTNP
ncbi:MAG TPA: response regulator [Candidatus Acidoferrum sp.]|nr:response regulator [Candidatus Acidoferrum sp.]